MGCFLLPFNYALNLVKTKISKDRTYIMRAIPILACACHGTMKVGL